MESEAYIAITLLWRDFSIKAACFLGLSHLAHMIVIATLAESLLSRIQPVWMLCCLFSSFQCTDLRLTWWLTYFPFFSPLTSNIWSVSLLYPVLFVRCFILDRLTICYDLGLWALGIEGNISFLSVTVRYLAYLLGCVRLAYLSAIPNPPLTFF